MPVPTIQLLAPHPTEDPAIWLLRAYISDLGGSPTAVEFHYGATTDYGTTAAVAGNPAVKTVVTKAVRLVADTTYHVRVRGTNTTGATDTADSVLQTSSKQRWRAYSEVA